MASTRNRSDVQSWPMGQAISEPRLEANLWLGLALDCLDLVRVSPVPESFLCTRLEVKIIGEFATVNT